MKLNKAFAVSAACACLISTPVFSAVLHQIDTSTPLKCTFSLNNPNRISVEGGEVKKVLFPSGIFSVRMEEETGQAYISPLTYYSDYATISVITASGNVQDIEVKLEKRSGEVVILHEPKSKEEFGTQLFLADQAVATIRHMLVEGRTPPGYVRKDTSDKETRHSEILVSTRPFEVYEGPFDRITLSYVKNKSLKPVDIREGHFVTGLEKWIFLEKSYLEKGENALLIICEANL